MKECYTDLPVVKTEVQEGNESVKKSWGLYRFNVGGCMHWYGRFGPVGEMR
jgi:hypothetical protein